MKSVTGKLKDVGFLGELWQQVRLVFYLIKDREVPIYMKVVPLAGILYLVFPIDLITDFFPVLGQLDDLTILLIGAKVFIEMAPPQVVARYMEQMRGQTKVVEGTAIDVAKEATEGAVSNIEERVQLLTDGVAETVEELKTAEPARRKGLFRRR